MTEQTKAVFENPQLLREKLGEFLDTKDKINIEKYAIIAENMLSTGKGKDLKLYFEPWRGDVIVSLLCLVVVLVDFVLGIFYETLPQNVIYTALGIYCAILFYHILLMSYRGAFDGIFTFIAGLVDPIACFFILFLCTKFQGGIEINLYGLFVFFLMIGVLFVFSRKLLFSKQYIIKHFASLIEEEYKIKKVGKNLSNTIAYIILTPVICVFFAYKTHDGRVALSKLNITSMQYKNAEQKLEDDKKMSFADAMKEPSIQELKNMLYGSDEKKAMEILSKKCDKNHAEACQILASKYDNNDIIKATSLKEKACNLGFMDSCFGLGVFYRNNDNYKKAYEYFSLACDNDNAGACRQLSLMYLYAEHVKQDEIKANELLNKAMRLFEPECYNDKNFKVCEFLGGEYEKKNNWANAIKFYSLSCEYGLPVACVFVATKYEEGVVITKDLAQAKEYYGKYCDLGFKEGCKEYKRLNN